VTAHEHTGRALWSRHGPKIRLLGVLYLALSAASRVSYALPRLLRDIEEWSALDLKYRVNEVHTWFSGSPVYGVVDGAVYPPASHAILWPFMGWLNLEGARYVWAIPTIAAATAIAWVMYRAASAASARDRLLVAGLALATYSLQICLFVGQMGMHVVAFAVLGAALLVAPNPRRGKDLLAATLLAGALVKPTLSLPLVVVALIAAGRLRPVLLLGGVYALLTAIATLAQPADIITLIRDWLAIASTRVPFEDGVPNIHFLLYRAGLPSLMTTASMVVLAALAAWTWTRRQADPWILLGVAGIVARLWAHSTLYDDAILLLPALALFRIAFTDPAPRTAAAAAFFAAAWATLLTPTWMYYGMDASVVRLIHAGQTALWVAVLVFLALRIQAAPRPA
jgi:hypothetical protein